MCDPPIQANIRVMLSLILSTGKIIYKLLVTLRKNYICQLLLWPSCWNAKKPKLKLQSLKIMLSFFFEVDQNFFSLDVGTETIQKFEIPYFWKKKHSYKKWSFYWHNFIIWNDITATLTPSHHNHSNESLQWNISDC